MSENNSHDEKSDSDKLKDDLEKAEEKIDTMEKKLEEQEKKTSSIKHYKSEGVTLILSIVVGLLGFMGVGHMYLGRIKRGVVILLIGVFGWIIVFVPFAAMGVLELDETDFEDSAGPLIGLIGVIAVVGIGYLVLFIWQILNARKLCREYNEHYEQQGTAPW